MACELLFGLPVLIFVGSIMWDRGLHLHFDIFSLFLWVIT